MPPPSLELSSSVGCTADDPSKTSLGILLEGLRFFSAGRGPAAFTERRCGGGGPLPVVEA